MTQRHNDSLKLRLNKVYGAVALLIMKNNGKTAIVFLRVQCPNVNIIPYHFDTSHSFLTYDCSACLSDLRNQSIAQSYRWIDRQRVQVGGSHSNRPIVHVQLSAPASYPSPAAHNRCARIFGSHCLCLGYCSGCTDPER